MELAQLSHRDVIAARDAFATEDWIMRLAIAEGIVVRIEPKESTMDKLTLYKDDAGEWRWKRQSENGEIVAASTEGYVHQYSALANIEQTQVGPFELIGRVGPELSDTDARKLLDSSITDLVDRLLDEAWMLGRDHDKKHPDDRVTVGQFRQMLTSSGLADDVVYNWLQDTMGTDPLATDEHIEWDEPNERA